MLLENRIHLVGVLLLVALVPFAIHVETLQDRGVDAFASNKPKEAIQLLSRVIEGGDATMEAYLYLGVAYQQVGEYDRAIETLKRGIEFSLPPHGQMYYNLGNNYFALGNSEEAEISYTQATAQGDAPNTVYLNRANARMNMKEFAGAVSDYREYLDRETAAPQREVIEEMIRRVEAYLSEEELMRKQEALRRKEEEERQRRLLESVLDSLENIEDDTVNLRADREDLEGVDLELDIED